MLGSFESSLFIIFSFVFWGMQGVVGVGGE